MNALLPIAPLLADRTIAELALATGFDRRSVHAWKHHGIDFYQADRAATALGLHGSEVWGAEWDAANLAQADIETPDVLARRKRDRVNYRRQRDDESHREFVRGCDAAENRRARFDRYIEVLADELARAGVA